MMRFVTYLKIQYISNLEPSQIYNQFYKLKYERINFFLNAKSRVQIHHVVHHMFLANYNKIQIITCKVLLIYLEIFAIEIHCHMFHLKKRNY